MVDTSDSNNLHEIEDLRVERLPTVAADKQVTAKKLLKVIILGDTGKIINQTINCPSISCLSLILFLYHSSIFLSFSTRGDANHFTLSVCAS